MRRIAILGAGGHGREVADILRAAGGFEILGFVDDDPELEGKVLGGLPVLGPFRWLERPEAKGLEAVVAFGLPSVARKVAARAAALGVVLASALSPEATVSPSAKLGRGVLLFPRVVVGPDVVIGDHVTLNIGASVSHDCRIGACTNVNPGVRIGGGVDVGAGCYLGMGASIIQDLKIGAGATVGAGAAVIRDVPPGATVVGVPARVIKTAIPETP
jgi:sugar O-acyltransferase (sialic acid O-acetyltransferase NeuD family)